ncbi:MAG TPA: dicarboxylate/amino acid:cation symporter [Burkholderiaceae bacterium]
MKTPFYKVLWIQVLIAIAIGVAVGVAWPESGVDMKPLGDGFIKLIKMIIAPVIFCTVVTGIAGMESIKKMGRVGGKALLYFEVVSTFALAIGLIVANVLRPGDGFTSAPGAMNDKAVAEFTSVKPHGFVDILMNIIPTTVVDAFAKGDILQVLLFSVLFGLALAHIGAKGKPVVALIDSLSAAIFRVVDIIMKAAPIGAFGAMAFTIGKYGFHALIPLAKLMGAFYLTSFLFIVGVLGVVAWIAGFSILRFIAYIKEELLIVLGTSSSESALPSLMEKLEKLGCSKPVVGLVVPTGYSFNLDGTNIYMTMAALFIAQATNTELSMAQQLTILGVAMLTSKGATGVTGAGFVTLAATLAVVPTIPIAGMALIFGIDRFMSQCRALTNFVGNGVATVVVSAWEKELDRDVMRAELGVSSPVRVAPGYSEGLTPVGRTGGGA